MIYAKQSLATSVLVALLVPVSTSALGQTTPRYQIAPHTSRQIHVIDGVTHVQPRISYLSLRFSPVPGNAAQYEHHMVDDGKALNRFKLRVRPLSPLDVDFSRLQPFEYPLARILLYWGCGDDAGAHQPKVIRASADFGRLSRQIAPSPIDTTGPRRLSQIPANERMIATLDTLAPASVRMEGEHELVNGRSRTRFRLTEQGEFLPPIEIASAAVSAAGSVDLRWKRSTRFTAYFASVFVQHKFSPDVVIWTSSRVQEAGWALSQSHPGSEALERLLASGVLLSSETESCKIPAAVARHASSALVVQIHGYASGQQARSHASNGDPAVVVHVAPRATTTLMFLETRDEEKPDTPEMQKKAGAARVRAG